MASVMRLRKRDDEGFTMIELMVALSLFAMLSTAAIGLLLRTEQLNRTNQNRVVAANLAEAQIESDRNISTASLTSATVLPIGTTTLPTQTIDGVTYTTTQTVEYTADTTTSGTGCTASAGQKFAYKKVTVVVDWAGRIGSQPVTVTTQRQLGVSGLSGSVGDIGIQVVDSGSNPVSSMPVKLTTPTGSTQTSGTDTNGCALFLNLAPGTGYTAELNQTGWLGGSPASQDYKLSNLSVTASQVTTQTMVYSQSATITAQLTDASGFPIPMTTPTSTTSVAVTVDNNGTTAVSGTTAAPSRSLTVTPVSSGYGVWAGDCTDANPGTYSGASAVTASATAGQSTTVNVALADLTVVPLSTGGGAAPSGTPVYAVHAPDTGCPSGESFYLGTTNGSSLSAALPYGTWTIASSPAMTSPPSSGWTAVQLTPTGSSVTNTNVSFP